MLCTARFDLRLRENGKQATEKFQETYSRIVTHAYKLKLPTGTSQIDARSRPQHYCHAVTEFAKSFCAGTGLHSEIAGFVHLFECTSYSSIDATQFTDSVAAAGCLSATSSDNHVVVCTLPQPSGGMKAQVAFKQRRVIEDCLLRNGFELSFCSAWRFTEPDHDNDKRPGQCWVLIAMKDSENNAFRSTNICTGRTTADTEKLIRCKDMVVSRSQHEENLPENISNRDSLERGARKITSAERLRQRGIPTTLCMLNDILQGTTLPSTSPIFLIDYFPTAAAEWAAATRAIALKQLDPNLATSTAVRHKLATMMFAEDEEAKQWFVSTLRNEIYRDWFDESIRLPGIGSIGARTQASAQTNQQTQPQKTSRQNTNTETQKHTQ